MVSLISFRAHDAGGPYRESWSVMCQELMSASLPLLRPCPNAAALVGTHRDAWILNPGATNVYCSLVCTVNEVHGSLFVLIDAVSADQVQMFVFLGKLMGIAGRSRGYMELSLAPIGGVHVASVHSSCKEC